MILVNLFQFSAASYTAVHPAGTDKSALYNENVPDFIVGGVIAMHEIMVKLLQPENA